MDQHTHTHSHWSRNEEEEAGLDIFITSPSSQLGDFLYRVLVTLESEGLELLGILLPEDIAQILLNHKLWLLSGCFGLMIRSLQAGTGTTIFVGLLTLRSKKSEAAYI